MHSAAQYLYSGDIFFRARPAPEVEPYRCGVPGEWSIRSGSEWTEYQPHAHQTPRQGWKIHVSAELDHAEEVLRLVAKVAVSCQVVFKHLTDRTRFLSRNSKLCARVHAGKFITLYPDDEILGVVLADLEAALDGYSGPYVLSDRRWKRGPIFLRYGAFSPVETPDGTFVGLVDGNGTHVEDSRSLRFSVPDFASRPEVLREWLRDLEQPKSLESLPFRVHSALKYSNSGGIYGADYCGRRVVVKEARPGAGLDPLCRDSVTRLNHEHAVISDLQGLVGIPEVVSHLVLAENTYLVEEQVSGKPLHHWASDRLAFRAGSRTEVEARLAEQANVLDALEGIIESMHHRGWAHLDLHSGNVLVGPDDVTVHLIDFENSLPLSEELFKQPMAAAGFGLSGAHRPELFDYQGLRQIALFLLWPAIADATLDEHRADHVVASIREHPHYLGLETSNPYLIAALDRLDRLSNRVHALLSAEGGDRRVALDSRPRGGLSTQIDRGVDWESALTTGLRVSRRRFDESGYPVHHHGTSRRLGGLGYGQAILERLTGNTNMEQSYMLSEHAGLFTGFVGDLIAWGGPAGSSLTYSQLSELLAIEGPRVFDGLPGILLGLASLPDLRKDRRSWIALSDAAERLARVYLTRPQDFAPLQPSKRTDSPDTHDSGLLYGHLGLSWTFSRFLDTGSAAVAEACSRALSAELNRYARVDGGRALALNQRTRMIPYLAAGSAGFGMALPAIPRVLWPDQVEEAILPLAAACEADGCSFPGLFNGMAGLQLGRAGLLHVAGLNRPTEVPTGVLTRALDLFAFGLDRAAVVQGDGAGWITCDLATGGAGVALALRGLRTSTYDLLDLISLLPSLASIGRIGGPQLARAAG